MKEITWTVEIEEEYADALAEFDEDRIKEELIATLEELASVDEKREDLHNRMNISSEDEEELSGQAIEEAMRQWLRGNRDSDPRLD